DALIAAQQGTDQTLIATSATLLASEVVKVHFQYSDGQQWYENWPPTDPQSAADAAQLPLAVHVVLYLKPPDFDGNYGGDMSGFPQRRMIVPLPAAEQSSSSSSH